MNTRQAGRHHQDYRTKGSGTMLLFRLIHGTSIRKGPLPSAGPSPLSWAPSLQLGCSTLGFKHGALQPSAAAQPWASSMEPCNPLQLLNPGIHLATLYSCSTLGFTLQPSTAAQPWDSPCNPLQLLNPGLQAATLLGLLALRLRMVGIIIQSKKYKSKQIFSWYCSTRQCA